MNGSLTIAGRELTSRLILGTGGFTNHDVLAAAQRRISHVFVDHIVGE